MAILTEVGWVTILLLSQSQDELPRADVDRDQKAGQNVAAERQRNGRL
jgi:hypothetical protein